MTFHGLTFHFYSVIKANKLSTNYYAFKKLGGGELFQGHFESLSATVKDQTVVIRRLELHPLRHECCVSTLN